MINSPTLTVHHGHCIDELRKMPAQSVHCVVTSPPYWGLRDYKTPEVDFEAVSFVPMAGLSPVEIPAWRGHLGLEPDTQMFTGHIVAVFREVWRVLRDDGVLFLNFGDSYMSHPGQRKVTDKTGQKQHSNRGSTGAPSRTACDGLKPKDLVGQPWRVAFAMQADGWYLRSDIIWNKLNPMPESVTDRPTKAHEYIFLLTKRDRYFYDAEAIKEAAVSDHDSGNGFAGRQGGSAHLPMSGGEGTKEPWRSNRSKRDSFKRDGSKKELPIVGQRYGTHRPDRDESQWDIATRNKRTVWSVASQPYSEAHFATFPPKLIEPCILAGTSAKGCCPSCGAPWVRMTEKVETGGTQKMPDGMMRGNGAHGSIHPEGREKGETGVPVTTNITVGWKPSCACPTADPIACTVLDPFGGSGTTGAVSNGLGRRCILIELGEHHLPLIERRCHRTSDDLNFG